MNEFKDRVKELVKSLKLYPFVLWLAAPMWLRVFIGICILELVMKDK